MGMHDYTVMTPEARATATKLEIARDVLDSLFADRKRIPLAEVLAAAKQVDVSPSTMRRASKLCDIHEVHNGSRPAYWERA